MCTLYRFPRTLDAIVILFDALLMNDIHRFLNACVDDMSASPVVVRNAASPDNDDATCLRYALDSVRAWQISKEALNMAAGSVLAL